MILRVGYFHFGINHHDPVGSLASALVYRKDTISNSLIVLPELIDIGTSYHCYNEWKAYDPTFASRLAALARAYHIIVVAGIRIPCNGQGDGKYYNASVLIAPDGMREIHRKNADGIPAHFEQYCGLLPPNPSIIENAAIGSLICADVNYPLCYSEVLTRFENVSPRNKRPRILAIPSFMSKSLFGIETGHLDEAQWRGYYVVLANSRSDSVGHESFVALPNGQIATSSIGERNEIVTHPIAESDWRPWKG